MAAEISWYRMILEGNFDKIKWLFKSASEMIERTLDIGVKLVGIGQHPSLLLGHERVVTAVSDSPMQLVDLVSHMTVTASYRNSHYPKRRIVAQNQIP